MTPTDRAREIAKRLGDVPPDNPYVVAVLLAVYFFDMREGALAEQPEGDHRARDIETLDALAAKPPLP